MINKKIIAQRKAVYGDNFKCIAKRWTNNVTKENLLPDDTKYIDGGSVARMMALMKDCRIDAIKARLKVLDEENNYVINDEMIELDKALKDSQTDKENYLWIAENYEEYKEL
ncbi:MAG: hypothetical protein DRG78_02845 [Epsilonproteobacteria bacterium]|nr:MAG: hypothetical protein DRG78_02845 [Campylobacterota bacterium]